MRPDDSINEQSSFDQTYASCEVPVAICNREVVYTAGTLPEFSNGSSYRLYTYNMMTTVAYLPLT